MGEKTYTYFRRAQYHETDQMGIIHDSFKEYVIKSIKKQVSFDDEIEIRVSVKKYNGVSLEFDYTFFNRTKNEICTTAFSRHCFLKDGRLISVKKELPALDERIREFAQQVKTT